jgi:predicted TIM-barrel fold metal-dependent hydrolase
MNNWILGRDEVAGFWSQVFSQPFKIIPVRYKSEGSLAYLIGYIGNVANQSGRPDYLGTAIIVMEKERDGIWRIANLSTRGGAPRLQLPVTAEQFIAELDAAGIQRANILSAAFVFAGSPEVEPGEAAKVREENDWNAQQAAKYPARLTAFCSLNPLKAYAVTEVQTCGRDKRIKGLKLHFGDSRVDLTNPEHLRKVQDVFRLANKHSLAIAAHIRTSDSKYDPKATATILLQELLPLVVDVPVQIAHMTGDSGFGAQAQASFEVLAAAIEARDPRTKKLYLDGSGPIAVGRSQSDEDLKAVAAAMRRVGLNRVLFASDRHAPNNAPPAQTWKAWLEKLPFTEAEFRDIADNVIKYRD